MYMPGGVNWSTFTHACKLSLLEWVGKCVEGSFWVVCKVFIVEEGRDLVSWLGSEIGSSDNKL